MEEIILFSPVITNTQDDKTVRLFYCECKEILDRFISLIKYIDSLEKMTELLGDESNNNGIVIFFDSFDGYYENTFLKLLEKYQKNGYIIWPIAMKENAECRKPPAPVAKCQSFDYASKCENLSPYENNYKAIAKVFSRMIIAQAKSPLYQNDLIYFISHRRSDGEKLASKLADKIELLAKQQSAFRDVVKVKVGENAQEVIDDTLKISDVIIFLQTADSENSEYIIKELNYAVLNDIPVLWIQIDDAPYDKLKTLPCEKPVLKYNSDDFYDNDKLTTTTLEIMDKCFELIINSSNQVLSYIDYFYNSDGICFNKDKDAFLAYQIQYKKETKDKYDTGIKIDYIQCFGRNPKSEDIKNFNNRVKKYSKRILSNTQFFLLSRHGVFNKNRMNTTLVEDNYEAYIQNLEMIMGKKMDKKNKRIIISGAFPDGNEIYQYSLTEAVMIYAREIIRNGYILVFGAHPTFQNFIFEIGKQYSDDIAYSIEMHMSKEYVKDYDIIDLEKKCTLVISDDINKMRESMICEKRAEVLICLGGKVKDNKSQQGVDIEVGLAQKKGIPVALVGTVGGRSSQLAYEKMQSDSWSELNPWDKDLNENLFHNVTHRLMVKKLIDVIEKVH